jgi:outer membrane protein OmpA-like peptidoglycan-associated protein
MNYAGSVLGGMIAVIPLMASLTLASTTFASDARAQGGAGSASMGPREVLLGTSVTPRTAGNPATERDAQAYYDAAERELRLGRAEVAQRQLEQLISRYPNSAVANVARHDLIALYGQREAPQRLAELKTEPNAPQAGLQAGLKSNLGVPPQTNDVPFAIGSADAAPGHWRTTTITGPVTQVPITQPAGKRPTRTVQDTFRQSAGDLVFFSDGSAELGTRARRVLEAQAEWLQAQPTARVTIEGHADDSGSAVDNLKLSEARAKAVQARLVEAGIAPGRLSAPIASPPAKMPLAPPKTAAWQRSLSPNPWRRPVKRCRPPVPLPAPHPSEPVAYRGKPAL